MKKTIILLYGFLIFISICSFAFANQAATRWHTIAKGLQYTKVYPTPALPLGAINAFKINLNYYHFESVFTHNTTRPLTLIRDLVISHHAFLGINGGFFGPGLRPLGLRITKGKKISTLKNTSWWGVFFIKNNKAYIRSQRDFKSSSAIQFAVQSGPRLIINNRIPKLKAGLSFRSALGITKNGEIIIAITNHLPISTHKLAEILKKPFSDGGLGCVNAINLDGGSSSQLYADVNGFELSVPSFAPIADAILVFPN